MPGETGIWVGLAPSAITMVGWAFIFRQNIVLKCRGDVYNIVKLSKIVVDEIYELSKKYYEGNDSHIGFLSADIRSRFTLLSLYLLLLRERGVSGDITKPLLFYRSAVMGSYFETVDFKKQMDVPNRRADISNSRSELNFEIEKIYLGWSKKINFISQFWMVK